MGVARAWSRWPTEIFSPSLMHTVNDYLSDVGSKKAVSVMVLEKNVPPIVSFFYHGHSISSSITITRSLHLFVYYRVPPVFVD